MGRALGFAAFLAVVITAAAAAVFERGGQAAYACGAYGPFDFETYEANDHVNSYKTLIGLAVEGKAVGSIMDIAGQPVDLRYQGLEIGDRAARPTGAAKSTSVRIPPTIYYATAWIEANWQNAASTVPWGGVGPTIRSFDCGYGIGQVTTGMANTTGSPSSKQTLIGTNALFNIAEGVRIMADKWNSAPEFRPVAGEGNPAHLEDWYYAIWSYNGFAFSNHPLNPVRDPLRKGSGTDAIYHCYDQSAPSYVTAEGGTAPIYAFSDYTYPEKVYGCMRFPPTRSGARMWQPVTFNMPDMAREVVAEAFDPEHFEKCEDVNQFLGGCIEMDFPTTFADDPETPANEALTPHEDIVPPTSPVAAGQYYGSPSLQFSGPSSTHIEVSAAGVPTKSTVTVANTGTRIAVYRVRTSAPWLIVTGPGPNDTRSIDGGVAIGSDVEVVITGSPLSTKQGHTADLRITANPAAMPYGAASGTVWFEPIFGAGSPLTVSVSAQNNYQPPTPTPTPGGTAPTPTPTPITYRATLPGLASH